MIHSTKLMNTNCDFQSQRRTSRPSRLLTLLLFACSIAFSSHAASLIDVWRADDLKLNDSDAVGSWSSASNSTATASTGEQPILKLNVTPGGHSVVRFNGTQRMSV